MSTELPVDPGGEWISQAEAARRLGVSRQAISKMVRANRLRSFSIGGRILVSRIEIAGLVGQGAPPGLDRVDLAAGFLAAFDRLPERVRGEVLRLLKARAPAHPLEVRLGATWEVILDALDRSGPMMIRGLRGVMAEAAFGVHVVGPLLERGWSNRPIAGDPPYDFLLDDGQGSIRVQVKLQRSKAGRPMLASEASRRYSPQMHVVETQQTRGGQAQGQETRPYRFGEFDLLAVSMYPSALSWESFRCTVASWLVPQAAGDARLAKFQPITLAGDEDWTSDFLAAVDWLRSGNEKTIRI